jgi:hypothetical protein
MITGATSLGLIVLNVGTLYRLRYPFWIVSVVLGSIGALEFGKRLKRDYVQTDLKEKTLR